MGTKITADILAENHINNEQKLWRHVILNAFEDCRIEAGDRKSSLNKTDAHFWIARSKDFDQICWWAGWEPDDVRFRYYKALKKGDIKFKRKHFLWFEYNELFQRLKKESNLELRKTLRRNLENKRKQIMLADNVLPPLKFVKPPPTTLQFWKPDLPKLPIVKLVPNIQVAGPVF